MKKRNKQKSGSALLLTLLVVSLLLVIVLSLTVYVRLELRTVGNRNELLQARQNAKLGMHLALAQLQRAAGPDQRVTATAAIIGDTVMPWRTGVWDTTDSSGPEWLLSTGTGPLIPLVSTGSLGNNPGPNEEVQIPRTTISKGSQPIGAYAYWVADEGVKASVGLPNKFREVNSIDSLTQTEIERLRYITPVRSALEFLFGDSEDFESETKDIFISKVQKFNQFVFDTALGDPAETGGFHSYTANARGLIINPTTGGIKKDLSLAPALLGSGLAQYLDYTSYMESPSGSDFLIKNDNDLRRLYRIAPPNNLNPATNEIVHSVAPIITDFGIQFSPKQEGDIAMRMCLELWNPYSAGLIAEDLELIISGFEDVIVKAGIDPADPTWQHTYDLASTFGDGNKITIHLTRDQVISSPNPVIHPNSYDANIHGPGRILYWIAPNNPDMKAAFGSKSTNRSTLTVAGVPAAPSPMPEGSAVEIQYEIPETKLTIELRRASDGAILSRFNEFTFDETNTGYLETEGDWDNRFITYQIQILERGHSSDRSLWLKHIDRRDPQPAFSGTPPPNPDTMFLSNVYTIRGDNVTNSSPAHTEILNSLKLTQEYETFLFDRVLSTSEHSVTTHRDLPLYELPRQPLISIGQLQHLHIAGKPPYSLGNPWGDPALNRIFDDYYFSGLVEGISIPSFTGTDVQVPHPRYRFTEAAEVGLRTIDSSAITSIAEDAAILLKIDGQFNINSTSVEAWKTVLGGLQFKNFSSMQEPLDLHSATASSSDWIAYDDQIGPEDYPFGFTRFPQSIQEIFNVNLHLIDSRNSENLSSMKNYVSFLNPRETFPAAHSLTQGFSDDFSPDYESTANPVHIFAQAIVDELIEWTADKGRPVISLAEFLSADHKDGKPLLEYVLQENDLRVIYTLDSGTTGETPEERTPGWLSQADIMTALAPILNTRSDTFKIRAYGNALIPGTTQITSEAWCEAVVERIITPVGMTPTGSAAELSTIAAPLPKDSFGRTFKIRSFKWLDQSEI